MFTKILLASDGSDGAQKATELAAHIVQRFDAELTVLHVFTPPAPAAPFATGELAAGADPTLTEQWARAAGEAVADRPIRPDDEPLS